MSVNTPLLDQTAALQLLDAVVLTLQRGASSLAPQVDGPLRALLVDRLPKPEPEDADDATWHEEAAQHFDKKADAWHREHPYQPPEVNPFANTARAHRRAAAVLRAVVGAASSGASEAPSDTAMIDWIQSVRDNFSAPGYPWAVRVLRRGNVELYLPDEIEGHETNVRAAFRKTMAEPSLFATP